MVLFLEALVPCDWSLLVPVRPGGSVSDAALGREGQGMVVLGLSWRPGDTRCAAGGRRPPVDPYLL